MLTIPKEKHAQAQEIIERFMEDFDEEQDEYCGFEVELESEGVWISGEDSFDADQAAELAQMLVDELEIEEPFIFSWAYTCSKLRVDEFGGGACLIRKGQGAVFIDARNHVENLLRAE